ncbi:MAG TPA: 3-hydroxyacyl-CoA dehydrogenase NAD-binding domain-containing protein, partial [Thermoanaerobaculia bacterium]|nr:3-hydroxyacyl-CoA dehydrogenase NAD-binding domain-containing protein [Thermoanaerobaculia bacterium]
MTSTTVKDGIAQVAFRLEKEGDLGVLWFDLQGEKINKISSAVMLELDGLVDAISGMSELKYLVLASGKPAIFIAGADINEFTRVTDAAEAERFTRFGQNVFRRLAALPQISVAAINGACMGGGTEIALNCDYRIMSDSPKASIALPEVKLGIFPAWTGTTILPRLIGIPAALDMILTGKNFDGRRAKKIGLVDEVVPATILVEAAKTFVRKAGQKRGASSRTHFYLEGNPLARKFIFNKARKSVLEKTGGHYPAPLKAIEVMEIGFNEGIERGLAAEARGASELIMQDTAKNLISLFFLMEESKKDSLSHLARPLRKVGVLGAGVMGGGIAQIVVDKADIPVRMKDINWQALAGGMKAAGRLWQKKVERRRMSRGEMSRKIAQITTTTDWSGFANVDMAIEAVVENLEIKQQVLAEFESTTGSEALFASNTSSIPISKIAGKAARPENVAGMHFFNPVDRMPLVEVIRGEKSSDVAVATVAAFARKLGKTVVHCSDAPGFVVNRILTPYMNEAAFLLEEGYSVDSIDRAMTGFGMPMGPLALLDEVGIDVATKAGQVMVDAFPDRLSSARGIKLLLESGRLGKKNGRGVYLWKEGKRAGVDPEIYKVLGVGGSKEGDSVTIVERMILPMINEASLILDEGVVGSAGELDLAMIMGTGFPPFRGGLLRYA